MHNIAPVSYTHLDVYKRQVIWHQAKAAMNYNDELTGELVTYRLTSGSHPLLSIYRGNERIMKGNVKAPSPLRCV